MNIIGRMLYLTLGLLVGYVLNMSQFDKKENKFLLQISNLALYSYTKGCIESPITQSLPTIKSGNECFSKGINHRNDVLSILNTKAKK